MATLEKIRSKAGLLVIVVGLALFAFIIGDFLNSGSTYLRQHKEKIAEINGQAISIQEYQRRVEEMADVYKLQSGSSNLPEEYMVQIRQSVFDGIKQEVVLTDLLDKVGMTVSPEELFDMVQGENISPVLLQNQMFHNPETGAFDKTFFLNFLKSIDDENIAGAPDTYKAQLLTYKNLWLFWEKNIKLQRMEQKYTSLLSKIITANTLDAKDAFDAAANSANIVYAMQPYASLPDSAVVVRRSEVERLYNQRKALYKQAETKVLTYISVNIAPSEEDFQQVSEEIEGLKNEFVASKDVRDVVNENSEILYIDAFAAAGALDSEVRQFVAGAAVGEVQGPLFDSGTNKYRMFKLIAKTTAPDSVKVSHIMLLNDGKETALADSLTEVLKKGGDFGELARNHSVDRSAKTGGELGWFTEALAVNALGEDFKTTIFSAPLNEIRRFKSLQGTHLLKVTDKTPNVKKYKVADIDMTVSPSSKTYNNLYNALNQFISKNQDPDNLNDAAKEAGYNLVSNLSVTAANQTLGAIPQSRPVIRWAFEHRKGDVSDIFDCDSKYFVVAFHRGTLKEGYRSLTSVEPSLKAELIAEEKGKKIADSLKAQNLSSLEAYAQAMNTSIDSVKFISFNTSRIAGIGLEPKLNACISLAEPRQLSDPVPGNNGVYVFIVTNKEATTRTYNPDDEVSRINATNRYRYAFQVMQSILNNAKVVDNRIRFY